MGSKGVAVLAAEMHPCMVSTAFGSLKRARATLVAYSRKLRVSRTSGIVEFVWLWAE